MQESTYFSSVAYKESFLLQDYQLVLRTGMLSCYLQSQLSKNSLYYLKLSNYCFYSGFLSYKTLFNLIVSKSRMIEKDWNYLDNWNR